jgi:hypothetical protein
MDPKKIRLRESCDSDEHPNSTPIIIGLDVTGSMGYIAHNMATEHLGRLISGIYERRPVTDPHVMLMGIGDAFCDEAPLQVTQFEADIRIAEQLRDIWLEGHGGGNDFEGYDLPWVFASRFTKIDSMIKRGKKGFIFTIGDELPSHRPLTDDVLTKIFGFDSGLQGPIAPADALAAAQRNYAVFHVVVEQGSFARGRPSMVVDAWRKLLGPNVLPLNNDEHLPEVIEAALAITNGTPVADVLEAAESPSIRSSLQHAFEHLLNG